jgi:hypothetical protein
MFGIKFRAVSPDDSYELRKMVNLQHMRTEPIPRRGIWNPRRLYLTSVANLLLAVFGFGLIAPALDSEPASKLPACCRREGKHHCAVASPAPSTEVALRDASHKCPRFPGTKSVARQDNAYAPTSSSFHAAIVSHPALFTHLDARYRISSNRSHQKRGPPSLLSC